MAKGNQVQYGFTHRFYVVSNIHGKDKVFLRIMQVLLELLAKKKRFSALTEPLYALIMLFLVYLE